MNITSKIVALSSALAFALQISLALLMLRNISPEAVGIFSVISQIGFFWATLALSQSPLRLLANHGTSVFDDARKAWDSSVQRFVLLLPFAALAVWFSGLSFLSSLLWALLLSLFSLAWTLAQSMRLRMVGTWTQVGVRVLPPLVSLLAAVTTVYFHWDGPVLLVAAMAGYATGSAWLLPALIASRPVQKDNSLVCIESYSEDNRSTTLRMAHSLVDTLLATAVMVTWLRFYGPEETGWMTAPLRVMGYVPVVVHMAWAQVLLAQPQHARSNHLWVGIAGFACVALSGAGCGVALEMGWLGAEWLGVWPYLIPLVIWQGSACFAAAYSHLPFQSHDSRKYSWACMGVALTQGIVLLLPVLHVYKPTSQVHLLIFSVASSISLLILTFYIHCLYKQFPQVTT